MSVMPIILISILVVVAIILAITDRFLGSKGEKKIIINKNETVIPVNGDNTLLNFLSEKKIYIPSACGGKGTCGHCKVKVINGGGNILPTEELLLSKAEKQDGIRLACQVKVKEDIEIELSQELLSVQEYKGKVVEIKDLTQKIKFVKVELPTPIDFIPGQYAQIKVPGVEVFRAYSIASKPSDRNILEFLIRYMRKGVCTTYIHKALEVGDYLTITGPYGHFYLHEDSDKEIVCVARGSGMAPIRSIIYHLIDQGMPRKITYFYGGRTRKDLFLTEELFKISKKFPNFTYVPALSNPDPDWTGEVGVITDVINRYYKALEHAEAYLCGSPRLIDPCAKVLRKNGMKDENIYYDKF